jgi:hypothetical protein
VITKLTFNEQGRILYHRDWWDIRDLISLIPGAQPAQWILTRVAARGLSSAMRVGSWLVGGSSTAQGRSRAPHRTCRFLTLTSSGSMVSHSMASEANARSRHRPRRSRLASILTAIFCCPVELYHHPLSEVRSIGSGLLNSVVLLLLVPLILII